MKPDEAITKIADLIKGIPVAMLTTVTEDGHLHSRPMATQVIPLKSEILFLTGEHSGKVDEVRNEHEVALTYTGNHTFLTVSGRGTVSAPSGLFGGSASQAASFTAGASGTEGSTSIMAGFPETFGWSIGRSRRSLRST